MQAFLAVARHGGFSAAARELGVATSVVTKRIEQLEWQTKSVLFQRSTRSVRLTEAGAAWLPKVESAVRGMNDVLDEMISVKGEIHGPIRLKVPTTLALFYLTDVLMDFQTRHPGVTLDLVLYDRLINPNEEDFDLAVAGIPGGFPDVLERTLCRSRRLLCAAPEYLRSKGIPKVPHELSLHDLLLFGPMGTCWVFNGPDGEKTIDVEPKLTANDGQVVLAAALAGKGIALLAQYTVAPAIAEGRLVQVLEGFELPHHWLRAMIPSKKVRLPRLDALVSHLKEALNPMPPWEE